MTDEDLRRAKVAEWARLRRARRKAAGFCTACDEPPADGTTLCTYHLEQKREGQRRRRAIEKAELGRVI